MCFSAFVNLAGEISALPPLWRLKLSVYFHLGKYYLKQNFHPALVILWAELGRKPKWLPLNRKLALVGIIPNQVLFSFISDKDRRTDSRIRRGCAVFFRLIRGRLSVLLSLSELKEKRTWLPLSFG